MKKGCYVPFPEKLKEQYEVRENMIVANVGTDKVKDMLYDFIATHKEWLFFILEIPTNWNDEPKNEQGELIVRHKDVYYIDACTQEKANNILSDIGELLIEDGMNLFGFGGHESKEEILFDKYNVLLIYTKNREKYEKFLQSYNIEKTDKLITAWDTFSSENYGQCELYEMGDRNIYSIVEEHKNYGLYFAERREE